MPPHVQDVERAREVYRACLEVIPHKKFTFGKVWLLYALLEVRQHQVSQARKILGQALGRCPKDRLFRGYLDLELKLREFDRCRVLYEKWLEFNPANCTTWIKYAELETALGDKDRARGIFELAVGQAVLDMPEVVWKAYIDFETEEEEYARARDLYRRLLDKTHHVKVYLAFAAFEAAAALQAGDIDQAVQAARRVYQDADNHMRDNSM